jgi:DNA processing protein
MSCAQPQPAPQLRRGVRPRPSTPAACPACLRRSWLLSALSGVLDRCARDRVRLLELLALADDELIATVAGRRTGDVRAEYGRFETTPTDYGRRIERGRERTSGLEHAPAHSRTREPPPEAICRHSRLYPSALKGSGAPHTLTVLGGAERLARLTAAPTVAIVGSRAPSDYGRETARALTRGLAASGVTVVAGLADGVAAAALAGVQEAQGHAVAVLGDGLGVPCPPRLRPLRERITRAGCAVSELPNECAGRRWGQLASARIVARLAPLSVVVEARETPEELAAAVVATSLGHAVAAVPGRVSSPLSRGTNALLMDGASLARGPRDVLELLYKLGTPHRAATATAAGAQSAFACSDGGAGEHAAMRPALRAVLERVGAGYDTPDKLARAGLDTRELLPALSELELTGMLTRGDGGRYLPRDTLD